MRVLITGAASGFGRAVADALRSRGDAVRGIDVQQAPAVLVADVRDQSQVDAAVATLVEELGGLDALVNNAGIGEPCDAGARPNQRVIATLETNFLGAWRVTAAALPALLRSRGRVINVASGLSVVNMPFAGAYAASKRALAAYSDVLRLEYGNRITVTTVYPGYVRTPIHRLSEEMGLSLAGLVPSERLEAVVGSIVRAIHGRARRDVATSIPTAIGIFLARHIPSLSDRLVRYRVRRLAREGRLGEGDLVAALVERIGP